MAEVITHGMASPLCLQCLDFTFKCACETPIVYDVNRHTTELMPFVLYKNQISFETWVDRYTINKKKLADMLGIYDKSLYGDSPKVSFENALKIHIISAYEVDFFDLIKGGDRVRAEMLGLLDSVKNLKTFRENRVSSGNSLVGAHVKKHLEWLKENGSD